MPINDRKKWSDEDLDKLKVLYPTMTARELAPIFGCSVYSVRTAAYYNVPRKCPRHVITEEVLAKIRELNQSGHSDTEISQFMQICRKTATRLRKKLGLPSNAKSTRFLTRIAHATAKTCEEKGYSSLADMRSQLIQARCDASGWAKNLRPRHVQILNLLAAKGPMTRKEITEGIGLNWLGGSRSLKSSDPEGCYIGHLIKRRLLVNLGRISKGVGSGRSVSVYSVTLTAKEIP